MERTIVYGTHRFTWQDDSTPLDEIRMNPTCISSELADASLKVLDDKIHVIPDGKSRILRDDPPGYPQMKKTSKPALSPLERIDELIEQYFPDGFDEKIRKAINEVVEEQKAEKRITVEIGGKQHEFTESELADLKKHFGQLPQGSVEIEQDKNQNLGKAHHSKEESLMNKLIKGFKDAFGKVEGQFAFAMNGQIAIRKNPLQPNGDWVTFDRSTNTITDVSGMTLDFNVPAFKVPTEHAVINAGDIVVNTGRYGYVVSVNDDYLDVIYPNTNSRETVLPTTNMLLQKAFYTKVSTLDTLQNAGGNSGGFNPLLLAFMSGDKGKDDLLPLLLMGGALGGGQAAGASALGGIDPMMFALIGDGDMDNLFPFLLLQSGGFTQSGFNPLMLLLMGDDDDTDSLLPLMLMGGVAGGQAGAQGANLFSNPLMLMTLLGDKKSGKGLDLKSLLMMQAMGGQGQIGAQNPLGNPMMMMALAGDSKFDMKEMLMMQAMSGGNLFGQPQQAPTQPSAPAAPTSVVAPKSTDSK